MRNIEGILKVLQIVSDQVEAVKDDKITNGALVEKYLGDIEIFNSYMDLILTAPSVLEKGKYGTAVAGSSTLVLSMLQTAYERGQASVTDGAGHEEAAN